MNIQTRDRPTPDERSLSPHRVAAGRKVRVSADPRKFAIYARYSTTGQTEVSIERQVEACQAYVSSVGGEVVAVYADRARSGAYAAGRDGLERMEHDAKAGRFGGVVVENVDRLARDLGVLTTSYKRLLGCGVSMYQPGRGKLSLTDIAVQGLMSDEGRRIMSDRSQHSRNVMAREGLWPTGPSYGYASVPGSPGHLVIVDDEAAVVRRIYRMRLEGLSPRQICSVLHGEGVGLRRGRPTAAGVAGILANERYVGRIVYGRNVTVRDRETGRKTVFQRPRAEWIVSEAKACRIVDDETWERVQALRVRDGYRGNAGRGKPSQYMLSNLVRCPRCNEEMVATAGVNSPVKYECRRHLKDKTCDHVGSIDIRNLEGLVLGLIAERLDAPGFVEAYVDAYNEERARAESTHVERRTKLERRVDQLSRQAQASFEKALNDGFASERVVAMRATLEARLSAAEAELAAMPRRPAVAYIDRGRLKGLGEALRAVAEQAPYRPDDEAGMMLTASIRDLIERIDVRTTGFRSFDVSVRLRLGPLVEVEATATRVAADCVLEGSYRRPSKAYAATAKAIAEAERFSKGEFDLVDDDWAVVDGLLAESRLTGPGVGLPRRRAAVRALVYLAMTGSAWTGLPQAIGTRGNIYMISKGLREDGTWDGISAVLAARRPNRFSVLLDGLLPTSGKRPPKVRQDLDG